MVMKINRINYEQFAIDYLEGNLEGDVLKDMEKFLLENPDLKKELDEMELYYLEPDEGIVFPDKEMLKKKIVFYEPKNNFGAWLLAAILVGVVFSLFIIKHGFENEFPINAFHDVPTILDEEGKIIIENNLMIEKSNTESKNGEKEIERGGNQIKVEENNPTENKDELNRIFAINPDVKKDKNNPEDFSIEKNIILDKDVVSVSFGRVENIISYDIGVRSEIEVEKGNGIKNINDDLIPIEKTLVVLLPEIQPVAAVLSEGGKIGFEELVAIDVVAPSELARLGRLEKWGVLPEGAERKIKFSNLKKTFIPEAFASK